MPAFNLDLERIPTANESLAIFRAKGKLSLETVSEFVKTLRPEPAPYLILDLSGLTFLDSSGVGSLVSLFVNRRSHGKKFALAGLTAQSSAVVTVAGLQNLLPVYKTLDEATAVRP
jgi:anti-anti-sigma factor